MLQDLKELAAKLQSQYQLTFNEGDRNLPENFKNLVRNIEGAQVEYFDHSFVVESTSKNRIYFPNQLWFVAAYFSDLYESLEQYAAVVKSFALSDDIIKNCKGNLDYTNEVLSSVKNIENADRDKLALFLSDYSWWGGGKGVERADYYYSPIISQCGLVNASQSYVAEMCKFLAKNPQAANILKAENAKSKPLAKTVSKELLFESNNIAEFMGKVIIVLQQEDDLSRLSGSLLHKYTTIGFLNCNFAKEAASFDANTDERRKDDCDKTIVINYQGKKYYYYKEQTLGTLKIFAENVNKAYKNIFVVYVQKGIYRLYRGSISNPSLYSLLADSTHISSDYRPYITAIKSKPFLLLAGISGTGKSRIVRELARACWDADSEEYKAHKPSNFEMVQVKPNWHDSSELIGYVSRVSGEPVYVAGPFLKFVAKAWEKPDVPYFLCLDEMNLAPVEQYFAEYLSVVESRKSEDGVVKTDPILPKSKEDWFRVLTAELTMNDALREQFLVDGICIPQNLIVVGTVNMDETTFSFSRKVLDRAMTIEMNEVDLTSGLDKKHEGIGKLDKTNLIGTAVEGCDVYNAYKADCDIAIAYLNAVNQHLEKTSFKVAYRTRNEFLLYVVNNLPYNKDKDGKDVQHGWLLARALDEITCMKVLSRIEGDETKVSKEFLSELTKEIKTQLEKLSGCTYTADRAEENKESNVWYSRSLDKLDEMTKRLESGYTSFWS